MLSPIETAARLRGQAFKRYIRAAAALQGVFDDVTLGDKVGVGRGAVKGWWLGARPGFGTVRNLALVTCLPTDALIQFVHYDGPAPALPPASGPAGLQEGVRRAEEHPDDEGPDTPVRSPARLPHDDGEAPG